jgi:hypothetical protein
MANINKEELDESLGELNEGLREKLIDTKLISISYWNTCIAPLLSKLSMSIDEVRITPRTYKLPKNYFED